MRRNQPAQHVYFRVRRGAYSWSVESQGCQRLRVVRIARTVAGHSHRDTCHQCVDDRWCRSRRCGFGRPRNFLQTTVAPSRESIDNLCVAFATDHRHVFHSLATRRQVEFAGGATSGTSKRPVDGFNGSIGVLLRCRKPLMYRNEFATSVHKHVRDLPQPKGTAGGAPTPR